MIILDMVWILCIYQARSVFSQGVGCASGPCQNEAVCQDTDTGFQCFCVNGYAGEVCEINFDDCSSAPCRNNATCIDHVASYTCVCADGFDGQDCQLNIDECESSPCLRNGTCIDLVDSFICECISPFTGPDCSQLPCNAEPCENEAVCRNDLGFNESVSGFVCDCNDGFTGPRCEINLDDCNVTSCSGNGLCVDSINDYSCLCEPGWVGDDCESPVDDCIGNSCKNNATCLDQHQGYLCMCEPGYEGSLCERERDECSEWLPCKNDAVCVDLFGDYRCECANGWFGINCTEEVNECETSECQNGAQCIDVIGGFQCRCPPFYTGLLCETLYNPCAPEYNLCQNEANCIVPPDGKYRCFCAAGFTGVHCEVNVNECRSFPCQNNATCEDIVAGYICHCTPGWEGKNCQASIDECASMPCLHGGDCLDLHTGFECNCTREYQGFICDEAVDFCLSQPCERDGTCLSFVGGYKCVCLPPYTGEQCLDLIDSCQSDPCINNGTCMNTDSGFICVCLLPFTGKTCNERVDFCESEPCFLGTCVSLYNDFICVCPEYITGKQCTDLVDYCGDSPCKNEGNCINGEFDFRCVCAYGFTGRTCIEMIDFCVEEPCQNDANCTNISGGFMCICASEFKGDLCQTKLPSGTSSSVLYASSSLISSENTRISSLIRETTDVFSLFDTSTKSSEPKRIISTTDGHNTKSLTINQLMSQTSSSLPVLVTSNVSVYPTLSTVATSLSLSITPSSVQKSILSVSDVVFTLGSYVSSSVESTSEFSTEDSPTKKSLSTIMPKYSSTITLVNSSTITQVYSSIITTVHSSTNKLVYSSTVTPVYSSIITPVYSSTITPVYSSIITPVYSSLNTPVHSSTNKLVNSSTVTPVYSSIITPVYSSTITPVYSSTVTPVYSSTITPVYSSTITPVYSSTITPVYSSTITPVYSSTVTPVYSSTITPVYSSTVTPVYSSTITLVYSSTITPVYSSTITPVYSSTVTPVYSSIITPVYSSIITPVYSSTITVVYSSTITPVYSSTITPVYSSETNLAHLSPSEYFVTSKSTLALLISSLLSEVTANTVKSTRHRSFFLSSTVAPLSVKDSKLSAISLSVLSLISEVPPMSITSINGLRTTLLLSTDGSFLTTEISESRYISNTRTQVSLLSEIEEDSHSILFPSSVKTPSIHEDRSDSSLISSVVTLSYLKQISSLEVLSSTVIPTSVSEYKLSKSKSASFTVIPFSYLTLSMTETSEFSRSFSYPFTKQSSSLQTSFNTMSFETTRFFDASSPVYSFHSSNEPTLKTSMSLSSGDFISFFSGRASSAFSNVEELSAGVTTYSVVSSITSGYMYSTRSDVFSNSVIKSSAWTFISTDSIRKTASELHLSSVVYSSILSYMFSPLSTSSQEIQSVLSSSTEHSKSLNYASTLAELTFLTMDTGSNDVYSKSFVSLLSTFVSDSKPSSSVELTDIISLTEQTFLQSTASKLYSSEQTDVLITSSYTFVEYNSSLHLRSSATHWTMDSSMFVDSTNISVSNSYSLTQLKETYSLTTSFGIVLSTSLLYQISPTKSLQYMSSKSLTLSPEPSEYLTLSSKPADSFITQKTTSSESVHTKLADSLFSSEVDWISTEVISRKLVSSLSTGREEVSTSFRTFTEMINPTKVTSSEEIRTSTAATYSGKLSRQTSIATASKTVIFTDYRTLVTTVQSYFNTPLVISTTPSVSSTTPFLSSAITSGSALSSMSMTTPGPASTCDNIVCYNSGICRQDVSGPYCDCGEKYIGPQCKTESTACEGYICENGGVCVVTLTVYGVQVPKCSCSLPFIGSLCQSENLIYYPTFTGSSYMEFGPPDLSPDQSNEMFISVKTTQHDSTIMYSANQDVDYKQAAFISLHLTNGNLRYSFSCDGTMTGTVQTDMKINTGDVYEIIIRQVWSAGSGEWCTAALIINSRAYVSGPLLTIKQSQTLGKIYIGGKPRFTYQGHQALDTFIMDGYIGCVHNFQINKNEIDMVSMAIKGINIENCNVPVCQQNPCKNGATCHSSGEEWFCSCLLGYGGSLCERKLCGVNPCQHGGTCIILEEEQDQLCLCAYGRGGAFCEKELSVTLPQFVGNQYGYSSYIAYEHPHYVENDFEMELSMIVNNGSTDSSLILFLGNTGSYEGRRDFMAVGIEKGYVVFRFDLGSGYGQIYSEEELDMSLPQHLVKFGRSGHMGWIQSDYQRNVTGRSPGVLTALNTNSKLYVGNTERGEIGILPTGAEFQDGFTGCIFNLQIKNHITDFVSPGSPPGHVTSGRNIGQCSSLSCDQNPCQNGAECRDLGASIHCICEEGWKGIFCTEIITACDLAHACSNGSSCVPVIPDGYFCLCPLGKRGTFCEEEFAISDPLFLGEGSYMSFEPVYIKKQTDIKVQLKPVVPDGLLFYVAQRLHSHSGDFLSLTMNKGAVEMRVDMGTSLNIIRSKDLIDTGRWYTIEAGRNTTHGYISVDGETISSQLTGIMTFLDTTTHFYIGGLPSLDDASPEAFENEPVPFHGCMRELVVNRKNFQLDQNGAKSGRNIEDCDGTSCGYDVCKNGGRCVVGMNDTFTCSCTQAFVGRSCDTPVACSDHKCLNGECRSTGPDSHECDCYVGWMGKACETSVDIGASVQLKTESFIYLKVDSFLKSNKSSTDISFVFKSSSLHGVILWNGQTYSDDEDYFGVGIQDGRFKLVWNLGWYSKGEILSSLKLNDGIWHSVIIKREKQTLALDIDGITYESRVSGEFFNLDTFGHYFIGSFKEGRVKDMTLGYFTEPFNGCLKDLRIDGEDYVDFDTVNDGMNVVPCDQD